MFLLFRFVTIAMFAAPLAECPYDADAANSGQVDGGTIAIPPELVAILEYAEQFGGTTARPRPTFEQLCAISPGWEDAPPREEVRCSGCLYPAAGTSMGWVHALLGKPAEGASQYGKDDAAETFSFVDGSSLTLEYKAHTNPEACVADITTAQEQQFASFALPGETSLPTQRLEQNQLSRFCYPPYWVKVIKVRAPLRYLQCWRARRADIKTPFDLFPDALNEYE